MRQVNPMIQQKLAEIISRELECPPEFFISLSRINVDASLKTANVWISVIPFAKSEEALGFIIRKKGLIQKMLGKNIHLKFTPKLNFLIDDTEEKASEIDQILDNLH